MACFNNLKVKSEMGVFTLQNLPIYIKANVVTLYLTSLLKQYQIEMVWFDCLHLKCIFFMYKVELAYNVTATLNRYVRVHSKVKILLNVQVF